MAKKPQTEEKAKGLLKNVGNYKGKTLNLSKKQLGASGRAAAATRKIAISRTTYDPATKKVLGPMGKPITGRVDLGGGNIAVYKNGVRVRAQKPSTRPTGGGSGSRAGGDGNKPPKPSSGAGKRYEERKSAVGGNARRDRKTPSVSPDSAERRSNRSNMVYVPAINQWVDKRGWNEKTNPYNKGRVTGGPQSRADVPKAAALALALYPGAAGLSAGARALAARKAAKAAAAKAAANRNTVVGAQARNAATRGLPSRPKRQALPAGKS